MRLTCAFLQRIVMTGQTEELQESKERSFCSTGQVAVIFSFLFFAYKTSTAARELVEEAAAAGKYISLLQPVHPSLREARPGQYKLNPKEILALILMSNKSSPGIQPYFTQTWGNVQIKPEEIYLLPALCTFCGSSSGITKANPTFRNKLTKPLVGTEDDYFLI